MSLGWSIYVIFLTAGTIVSCLVVLMWTTKMEVDSDESSNTTGHVWDGDIAEGNNPLPNWWLYLFWLTAIVLFGMLLLILSRAPLCPISPGERKAPAS